jgi:hypothetical protein
MRLCIFHDFWIITQLAAWIIVFWNFGASNIVIA